MTRSCEAPLPGWRWIPVHSRSVHFTPSLRVIGRRMQVSSLGFSCLYVVPYFILSLSSVSFSSHLFEGLDIDSRNEGLINAISSGDLQSVKRLVSGTNRYNYSSILALILTRWISLSPPLRSSLIDYLEGVDVNSVDLLGRTPIIIAAASNRQDLFSLSSCQLIYFKLYSQSHAVDIVELLLKNGAKMSSTAGGKTAVHYAAQYPFVYIYTFTLFFFHYNFRSDIFYFHTILIVF